ncbi:hypothetical protein D3C86_979540 [compost metagenome]
MMVPNEEDRHPLVDEWLALFLSVTPETPFDELLRRSRELWHLYQRADQEVPGAIMATLDQLTPSRRRVRPQKTPE